MSNARQGAMQAAMPVGERMFDAAAFRQALANDGRGFPSRGRSVVRSALQSLLKVAAQALGRLSVLQSGAWRRRSARAAAGMRVVERLSVGPKQQMLVVRCRGRLFLVAAGAQEIAAVRPLGSVRAARRRRP